MGFIRFYLLPVTLMIEFDKMDNNEKKILQSITGTKMKYRTYNICITDEFVVDTDGREIGLLPSQNGIISRSFVSTETFR